jgi:16S rRNA G966 N2-methylase RsmD
MPCTSRRNRPAASSTPARRRDQQCPSRTRDLPQALWPCAQRTSQVQRRGRFVPESNLHPVKMLPEIARRAISAYSDPGDLVLDPMCGIATTLIEAAHLERQAIGIELEARWAALAAENIEHARSQGASGQAVVVRGDARQVGRGLLDDLVGAVPLILTSPPYGNAEVGDPRRGNGMARTRAAEGRSVTAADRVFAEQLKATKRYGDTRGSVAALRYGTANDALTPRGRPSTQEGRRPANVLLSHAPTCREGRCDADCPAGILGERHRFFYCAKPPRREREAGCEELPRHIRQTIKFSPDHERLAAENPVANVHPTVKPIDVMRWIVRLVTPHGGLVLDPFAGSGSTGAAAVLEGACFRGIEREAMYVPIARARIKHWAQRRPNGERVSQSRIHKTDKRE